MAKYRKRPIVIEAFQLTQTVRDSNSSWPPWAHAAWKKKPGELGSLHAHPVDSDGRVHMGRLRIDTLEGGMAVSIDDWIIQGVKGELYPCKPDIFAATYEPIA